MKLRKVLMLLGLVGALLAATVTSVSAFPSGSWVSGVTVANLSSEEATVVITFYNQDGTVALDFSGGTITGNGQKTWYLPAHVSGLPSGFIGSAVVSSNQEIGAIVNTQLPSGSNPMRVGTSTGVNSPSSTAYATQLMKNYSGWNSYCAVQNTGTTGNVTATYYNSSGVTIDTDTQSIPASASYIFDQSTDSELSDGVYSAKFEGGSERPLAVVCNFYNVASSAETAQFHSYNGIGQGGSKLYIPRVVKDYYYYQSGLRVQNVSSSETLSVTVTYNFGGTTYTQVSPDIGPGQAWGPYLGSEAQLPVSMAGLSGSGSASVEVNNPGGSKLVIATINEDNRVSPAGRGVTYEASLESEASDTVVFPQVTAEYYGYSSGLQVQKVTAGTASCTAKFSASGSVSAFDQGFTLTDANPSWSLFAPNASGMNAGPANDNYNGSVTVECTGGTVIGISNLSFRYDLDSRYGNLTGDSFTTARGIPK